MSKTLVIVESPAKAKTIKQFLGKDYTVEASFGHVRDLPRRRDELPKSVQKAHWADFGVDVDSGYEPYYVVPADKKKHVAKLRKAAAGADRLLLATDEDREGESISWHILEVLSPKGGTKVERIVFHEVTPEAIQEALANPRDVDQQLVRSQETRRVLDRLVGFSLSPLLWRKIKPGLSAGRVQSVAVRLIVQRERERKAFVTVEYWGLEAKLSTGEGDFTARLTKISDAPVATGAHFDSAGQLTESSATWLKAEGAPGLAGRLSEACPWKIVTHETKPGVERPPAPFMTSTLQQEANRKLGFTAKRTMAVAQQLYEGIDIGGKSIGLITYMRTDSLTMAERALSQARKVIGDRFGAEYMPDQPKRYKSKSKGAQEAHEAIRPTDFARDPESVKSSLDRDQSRLYDLIWKRAIASQMTEAKVERTRVEVEVQEGSKAHVFAASGKRIVFPGFLKAYVEGSDNPEAELGDKETILPEMRQGQELDPLNVDATEHATKPPARYTESTLVKKLEEEGVGRPSTYASIIGTIQDRGYVFPQNKALVPTFTAFAVTELLENHFEELVDTKFTARMEDELDEIASGEADWVERLDAFYKGTEGNPGLRPQIESQRDEIPFSSMSLGNDPGSGEEIAVRIGSYGAYIRRGEGGAGNTASIPEDTPPADFTLDMALEMLAKSSKDPEAVGVDPASGRCVFHKSGRYGEYLEVEPEENSKEKPKRVSVPKDLQGKPVSEEDMQLLMRFPRHLGEHPGNGEPIGVALGRYGPYAKAGPLTASIDDWRTAATITKEEAVKLLAEGKTTRSGPQEIKKLGELKLMAGRYGPYVTDGEVNATVPKGVAPESLTEEAAAKLIAERMAAGPAKRPAKRPAQKRKAKK